MRTFNRIKARGFTLVELMIVVAIIGVLAALAIFGVRKYLAAAKSAEARNTLGAINRASIAKYERETTVSELVSEGGTSAAASHSLCTSAVAAVPATVPPGKKYQPITADGADWNTGDSSLGWKCLRFGMSEPHYYSYMYSKGAKWGNLKGTTHVATAATGWQSAAMGDLNGDTKTFSEFATGGEISATGQPKSFTQVSEWLPEELSSEAT
jgi:type IV pilus assembly protein PilA